MHDSAARVYFESKAGAYLERSSSGVWAWQRRREATALFTVLGRCDGLAVLDLGCGAGYYTGEAMARGATHVTAVDISDAMLEQLPNSGVSGVIGDATTIVLDRHFPRIVSAGMFEFVTNPEAALANAARHLEPKGRLAVLVPNANWAGRLYRTYHRCHEVEVHLFSPAQLTMLAANCGLITVGQILVAPFTLVAGFELAPATEA